ncbi:MAG: hypothetical protein LPK19_01125, partial [Hymenobacteraceae bacterium]|nr:hypothetical protein [Hymenobacteraceae bacterium]MDX5394775.1 hypothetical protein [Hymenobacteraceae bacterium]MDX5510806.1 hypothetical protein [Hymenobacteraceae bacterium]
MKLCKKLIFLFAFIVVTAFSAQAQVGGYKTGIGLRGGWWPGLTVKHFIGNDAAIEGIVSTWSSHGGVRLTVLYEKHAPAFSSDRFLWYYGAGAHVGARNRYWHPHKRRYYDDGVDVGIDGILGLEFLVKEIPFTLGVDVKPYISFTEGGGFWDA